MLGSGDLFTPEDAARVFLQTGCDGLMFARGALGNPFIFKATKRRLAGEVPAAAPTGPERLKTALEQLELTVKFKGESRACKEMRKHFCYYSKGMRRGAEFRARAVRAEHVEDYVNLVAAFSADR